MKFTKSVKPLTREQIQRLEENQKWSWIARIVCEVRDRIEDSLDNPFQVPGSSLMRLHMVRYKQSITSLQIEYLTDLQVALKDHFPDCRVHVKHEEVKFCGCLPLDDQLEITVDWKN